MNSPQQSLATLAPRSPYGAQDLHVSIREDVALGCACADPALQIDCWVMEAAERVGEPD